MDAMDRLTEHLKTRISELAKQKAAGIKIVGYTPGGFMPEELVYAAGAVPICLMRGGDPEPVTESLAYVPRFLDTFCRSQIAYWALGEEPLYRLPDIMIIPLTDCSSKAIADCWDFFADVDVIRMGVPHNKGDLAFEYYMEGLHVLKGQLEDFTGNRITDERLREEIIRANRIRDLLKAISMMRRTADPTISSRDYVWLHHASLYADTKIFLEILESLHEELSRAKTDAITKRPRILFTGSTIALGDHKIFEILEDTEAQIVMEEFAEGMRPYQDNVNAQEEDLIKAMAEAYFLKRIPAPWDRPWGDRLDRLIAIARDYSVDGVLWYQMMYRDGYDMQAYWYEKELRRKADLPMLKLETDYTVAEKGPMKTRLETFIELMKGG